MTVASYRGKVSIACGHMDMYVPDEGVKDWVVFPCAHRQLLRSSVQVLNEKLNMGSP